MNNTFMKERPVFPLLMSMALPNVISMLVNSLYNIVDSLFVARINESAMTALSLVFPVQNLLNAIAIGFGIGINALVALCLGAGEHEKKPIRPLPTAWRFPCCTASSARPLPLPSCRLSWGALQRMPKCSPWA